LVYSASLRKPKNIFSLEAAHPQFNSPDYKSPLFERRESWSVMPTPCKVGLARKVNIVAGYGGGNCFIQGLRRFLFAIPNYHSIFLSDRLFPAHDVSAVMICLQREAISRYTWHPVAWQAARVPCGKNAKDWKHGLPLVTDMQSIVGYGSQIGLPGPWVQWDPRR
jgi:hypothetical protein